MSVFTDFDILVLDDDGELVHLLFERFHSAIQTLDLLALKSDNLLGVFELRALGLGILLSLLGLEEENCPYQAAGKDEVQNEADNLYCNVSFHDIMIRIQE